MDNQSLAPKLSRSGPHFQLETNRRLIRGKTRNTDQRDLPSPSYTLAKGKQNRHWVPPYYSMQLVSRKGKDVSVRPFDLMTTLPYHPVRPYWFWSRSNEKDEENLSFVESVFSDKHIFSLRDTLNRKNCRISGVRCSDTVHRSWHCTQSILVWWGICQRAVISSTGLDNSTVSGERWIEYYGSVCVPGWYIILFAWFSWKWRSFTRCVICETIRGSQTASNGLKGMHWFHGQLYYEISPSLWPISLCSQ